MPSVEFRWMPLSPAVHSLSDDDVFVIAEAGVNHNGSAALALELVHIAVESGADAVKFQSFVADDLATVRAPTARYQQRTTMTNHPGTQRDLLRDLELSRDEQMTLKDECDKYGLEFMSTAFDIANLRFLIDDLGVQRIKIASPDLTFGPLLWVAAASGREIILSTGMANLDEIQDALALLALGMITERVIKPSHKKIRAAFHSEAGSEALSRKVTLLHCTSAYPAPFDDVNLRAMESMGSRFGLPIGYSDHTSGIAIALAAVARGARD